jgi:hypothetical protein
MLVTMSRAGAALVLLLGASLVLGTVWRPQDVPESCVVAQASASIPDLHEASGLAVSRRDRGLLWSHNDSGNEAVLFALDVAGTLRGRLRVPIRTRDWEDISAAQCPSGPCLYLADIGDNQARRQRVTIYRIQEPAPDAAETAPADVLHATYPDGPHNAEAMFVIGDELFVVTRDRVGAVYRVAVPHVREARMTFERLGELGLANVSDAEASFDEQVVVVRNALEAVFYRTTDLTAGRTVPFQRIAIRGLREAQGEGVALDGDVLYLASEGGPWNRAGSLLSLRCRVTP